MNRFDIITFSLFGGFVLFIVWIDSQIRRMLDALTVQTMISGTREGYSVLIEKAVKEYFEKHGAINAKNYINNFQIKR